MVATLSFFFVFFWLTTKDENSHTTVRNLGCILISCILTFWNFTCLVIFTTSLNWSWKDYFQCSTKITWCLGSFKFWCGSGSWIRTGKNMDPYSDPGHFFKIYWNFLTKIFLILCLIFIGYFHSKRWSI